MRSRLCEMIGAIPNRCCLGTRQRVVDRRDLFAGGSSGEQPRPSRLQRCAGLVYRASSGAVEARHYPWVRPLSVRGALALPDTLRPAPGR
jgi:hypothetical protein